MSPSVSFPCSWFLCAISLGVLAAGASVPAASIPPVAPVEAPSLITRVVDAFDRWPEVKDDSQLVRIEGVVTGTMPSGSFRLHDGELGLYVTKSPAGRLLTPGDRVLVAGVLRQGGFSPWISPHEVTSLGRGTYPEARSASFGELASGSADNQWVEIEGVVRSVEVLEHRYFVELDLGMTGGNLRVLVNYDPHSPFEALIDAVVRLRGVAAVNVNKHGHVVAPSFRVPSFSEITVVKSPQSDAFSQPLVPVNRLMKFSPGALHRHRVRTSGVVTRRLSPTMFFVRDADVGLKVETRRPVDFRAGDVIDAAGFPAMSEGMAVLQQAVTRRVGTAEPPAPVEPKLSALLDGAHNSNLVSVRARLVDWVITEQNVTLILQSGDELFKGLLNHPSSEPLVLPDKNSLVDVTGICVINELDDVWFYKPRSFLLLLADLTDLHLVQSPPWWTPERLWRALAITLAVLLAAAGWVWALRRQIDRKRAVIEQQARHAAALEERSRIARELHDTLEQGLTGLSLQMKAMETDLQCTPDHPVRSRLHFARQMLRQSRALARNAIRELRTESVPARVEGLVDGLKMVANSWNHSGASTVTVQVVGEARVLPPRLEQHLVGIGTEAMTNAVKHGRADAIQVEIQFGVTEIVVRIKDTGVGFDPAQQLEAASGCFGLLGMRERVREIRGEIQINSQPGSGTEVIVSAPVTAELTSVEVAPHPRALPVQVSTP